MTTLVINYSQNLIVEFWSKIKSTLKAVMIGYMVARQTSANRHVAQQLSKYEYNGDNYWMILNDLNKKTIDQIHKEFGK